MRSRWCQAFCIGPETTSSSSPSPSTRTDFRARSTTMKRQNGSEGKLRRPVRRSNKIGENFYRSTLIYGKLLVLWATVLLADHFLDFRFEYLWPVWVFVRSVYDSFKYQGMAFSVFFVCISLTSDMMCYFFIPLPWLFFLSSTYVWLHYVWQTDRGISIPSVLVWTLLLYIEASIRLKELKSYIDPRQLPFPLDLCRPFAAHCIGYPVVSLGFSFKRNVFNHMKLRRQREVQKENEYYYQFVKEALPPGIREDAFNHHPKSSTEDRISDGASPLASPNLLTSNGLASSSPVAEIRNSSKPGSNENLNSIDFTPVTSTLSNSFGTPKLSNNGTHNLNGSVVIASAAGSNGDLDYLEKKEIDERKQSKTLGTAAKDGAKRNRDTSKIAKEDQVNPIVKMEADLKKYKIDLQMARNKENELRNQIVSSAANERLLKSEISNLQVEKSLLETRISSLLSARAGEKVTLSSLEKKLADERKQKAEFQIKLESERKNKKEVANAQQNQTRSEVSKLEAEIKTLRQELQTARDRCEVAEREVYALRQCNETHGSPEILANDVKNLKEKTLQLEMSLSSETKLKMNLFSALGDAKRELGILHAMVFVKDREILNLKAKIADVLAVMPGGLPGSVLTTSNDSLGPGQGNSSIYTTPMLSRKLPQSTDLSFNGKMSSLGLSDLEDNLTSSGIYSAAAQLANSPVFSDSKISGSLNGDN